MSDEKKSTPGYSHGVRWTEEAKDAVRKLRTNGQTNAEIAKTLNVSISSINNLVSRYGIAQQERLVAVPDLVLPSRIQKNKETEMRAELSKLGYKVEKLSKDKMDRIVPLDMSMFKGDEIKFGVLSCTHIGSKFQQLTFLKHFYKYCEDLGIKAMLHCGDMADGINVYAGQEFEIFLHGFDAQCDYIVENYPRIAGGKTLVISGNHDYSFIKEGGADVLADVASKRDDIEYLGAYGAYPTIGPNKIYMQHGGGKPTYALSYSMQKNIERMAPASKPDIYFLGHYHASCVLPEYRNVVAFQLGSFQAQTPHARRFSLFAEVGGLIVTMKINDYGRKASLADITFRWVPFYVPKDRDY